MTTVAIVTPVPLWTRVRAHLSNWGTKAVGFVKRVGNWFINRAKWLINTPPVQWIGARIAVAWRFIKAPALWVGLPALAVWSMPTATLILLGLAVLVLAGLFIVVFRGYKHVRAVSTHQELEELTDHMIDRLTEEEPKNGTTELSFDDDVSPGETVQNRLVFLDQQLTLAAQAKDDDRYSEIVARMNLINARQGQIKGIKSNASLTVIHRACRKQCETDYANFDWNWDLMYRGTLSESRRLKELNRLLAKGPLTPVK